MFTSEPTLGQRIGRMIGDQPIVDCRTLIRPDRPGAPDLAALLAEPRVLADLASSGMARSGLDPSLPPDEQVRRALPYLRLARNTASVWCLYRIFRDLYDFDEPHLDPTNYRTLFDRVAASARDPDWARSVLVDRAKVARFMTTDDHRADPGSALADRVAYFVDASSNTFGRPDRTDDALDGSISEWLDRQLSGAARFASLSMPVGPAAFKGPAADPARSVLRWHDDRGRTLRIVGPEPRPMSGSGQLLEILIGILERYPNARFDLMIACVDPRDQAMLAARCPNVTISGIAWDEVSAPSLAESFGHRVQAVPAVKVSGFSSDAPAVEWVYGRLQFARKAMGSAIGRLIEDGYFEEDEVPPLLRQLLHDSPLAILRAADRA